MSYTEFDPNDPDGNKNEYVEIHVREPKMVLLGMEIINDEECIITAMSSRRTIYKSKDQGVTWEFDHRAGYVEYWSKRIKGKWAELLIVLNYLKGRAWLYWHRKDYK